jgi:hypothetical protein
MNKNKENYFFEKKNYFLCLIICFLKKKIISLFFIETSRLDISIVTKMLIVNSDLNSNDDVSSNVNNWDFFDDEISFFIIDFETTFFLKLEFWYIDIRTIKLTSVSIRLTSFSITLTLVNQIRKKLQEALLSYMLAVLAMRLKYQNMKVL